MTLTRKTILKLPVIEQTEETKSFPLRKRLSRELETMGKEYIIHVSNIKNNYDYYLTEKNCIQGTLDLVPTYRSRAKKFITATEAREAALNWISLTDLRKRSLKIEIEGKFDHYSVRYPSKKDTYQRDIALSWYKDYRICIGHNSGMCCFIENAPSAVDIYLYDYDSDSGRLQPRQCKGLGINTGKLTDYIFRYSNTGEILGLIQIDEKGKKHLVRTIGWHLDSEDYRCKIDLRNQSLNTDLFHPDTMKILQNAGFETVLWGRSWGFNESVSRVNTFNRLMHYESKRRSNLYYHNETQRSVEINNFCKDLPFDEEHCVVPFKNGYIARFGKIIQAWQNVSSTYSSPSTSRAYDLDHVAPVENCDVTTSPATYTDSEGKVVVVSKLVEEKFIESVRIWISNTFSIRSVCVSKCGGTCWEPTRIDRCDSKWGNDSHFSPSNPLYTELNIDLEKFNKTVYEKLFNAHPRLKYLIGYTDRHPILYKGDDIQFLRALFNYQKVIETFISLGMDDLFWKSSNSHKDKKTERFNFDHFIDAMRLNEIPHKASNDFYQTLGLNKAQFKLIFKDPDIDYEKIMEVLYRVEWNKIIPNFPTDGWRANDRRQRAAFPLIPVQYIELIIAMIKDQSINNPNGFNTYNITNDINNFLNYGFDFKAIYKYMCIKRVNLQLYRDYLRMRDELERNSATSNFDAHLWDKKLDDADDVRFTHDRMLFAYNQWSAEHARYRCLGNAETEQRRQELYDKRYQILKLFNYHEKDDAHVIVVPEKLMEIIVEGQVLHHCVGSFVESVSEGRDTIVFLRNKAMPDVPYATVSLLYDVVSQEWYIDQAHTAYNGDLTEEDVSFLKRWGLIHKIRQNSIHTRYGARCHH